MARFLPVVKSPRMGRKAFLLVLCLVVVLALIALASSLHDVTFKPGEPFGSDSTSVSPLQLPALSVPADTPIWKILLFWGLAVLNIVMFFWLLPPEVRKRLLRQMLGFAVGVLAIILALRYRLIKLPDLGGEPAPSAGQTGLTPTGGSAPIPFEPPRMSPALIYAASLAAVLVIGMMLVLAYRRWFRLLYSPRSALKSIADIAQSSLHDLAAGRNWGDVIIECYVRMNQAVSARRGLLRPDSDTPREFADKLMKAGLPADPVNRLTRLFESVRYGAHSTTDADVRAATDCLHAILQACGVPA